MIVTENFFAEDGRIFKRTYSDAGFVIEQVQTGFRYAEAIDMHDAPYTYIETNDPVELPDDYIPDEGSSGYNANDLLEAAKILLGEVE